MPGLQIDSIVQAYYNTTACRTLAKVAEPSQG
jgi:hypothetical protein